MVILAAEDLAVQSTYHRTKYKTPHQIFLGQDMILPINHIADWRYIRHCKQVKINKDAIRENTTGTDNNYRVGDKFLTRNKSAYKYETLYKGPYDIFQTWNNGIIAIPTVAVTMRINICNIKPYNNTDVE